MSGEAIALGAFELLQVLGRGGTGEVWAGRHREDGSPVAIKIMRADARRDPGSLRRFVREVQAVAGVTHPGVVRVSSHGVLPEGLGARSLRVGSPYLVMERGVGPLDPSKVQRWEAMYHVLMELLDALAHVHARGLLHRDLKPANLLVVEDARGEARVKLSDFGLANAMRGADPTDIPEREAAAGTPLYMAPEQALGAWRDFGPWTDLYALGCVAHEMACGEPPFKGSRVFELAMHHLNTPPPTMSLRFSAPGALQAWVRRLLAKSTSTRFRSAADAARALREMADEGWSPRLYTLDVDREGSGQPPPLPVSSPRSISSAVALEAVAAASPRLGEGQDVMMRRSVVFNVSAFEVQAHPPTSLATPEPALPRPDIPSRWRARAIPSLPRSAQALGLALSPQREPSLRHREVLQGTLWRALERANEERLPRAIVLRGAEGMGKSALARWFVERAHELGAASAWRIRHDPVESPEGGIRGALEALLNTWTMRRVEVHERALEWLGALRPTQKPEAIEQDAALLTEMLRPLVDTPVEERGVARAVVSGPRERNALIARVIGWQAARGAVILWIDDAQWGHRALTLASFLMDCALPIVIVIAAETDALEDARDLEANGLAQIVGRTRVETPGVPRLSGRALAEVLQAQLALAPSLLKAILKRAEGHLHALQLVEDLIERDALRLGPEGFTASDAVVSGLPHSLDEVWATRLERLLGVWPESARHPCRLALEIAAALGRQVERIGWRAACDSALLKVPEDLDERLIDRGLARRTPRGWCFVHGALRAHLERRARERGRWADHHRRAAAMLRTLGPVASMEARRRRASHLFEAGDWSEALAPLIECAEHALSIGEQGVAERLLAQHSATLDALGWHDRVENVENMTQRASLLRARGNIAEAIAVLMSAEQLAWEGGWKKALGRVLHMQGSIRAQKGQYDHAKVRLQEALDSLLEADARLEAVGTMTTLARTLHRLEAHEEARAMLERACELCEALEEPSVHAQTLIRLARHLLISGGDRERAVRSLERARSLTVEVGDRRLQAHCWDALGQLASLGGDASQARRCFYTAMDLFSALGDFREDIERVYLATSALQEGDYVHARDSLKALRPTLERIGYAAVSAEAALGLSLCLAHAGNWKAWARVFPGDHACARLIDLEERQHALAWLAGKNGNEALAAGQLGPARQAFDLGVVLWWGLNEREEVARLERLLRGLDATQG